MVNINTAEILLFKNDWHLMGDFFDFFFGEHIGDGETRSVYSFQLDKTQVVKIERPHKDSGFLFDNVSEMEMWANINSKSHKHLNQYAKFLAPCIRISPCGRFLIQKKTTPVTAKELPKMIPYFLADTKLTNWGRIGKNVVCHDYSNHKLYSGITKNKLVKAEWIL